MIEKLIETVKQVCAYQMESYTSDALAFEEKTNRLDPVSEVDRTSQAMIAEAISKHFPEAGIVAEEDSLNSLSRNPDFCFAIDPLDGTMNFKQRLGIWAVSIGMLREGRFTEGLIATPLTGDIRCSVGWKGPTRRPKALSDVMIYATDEAFERVSIPGVKAKFRQIGCSVLSTYFCAQATYGGLPSLDMAVMGGNWLWDIAASGAFLREIGGAMFHVDGHDLINDNVIECLGGVDRVSKTQVCYVASSSPDLARSVLDGGVLELSARRRARPT